MFTRSITRALTASIIAGAATFALTPAAHAQDAVTRSITVSYADLDLANDGGVAALDTRIKRAARRICTTGNRIMLSEQALGNACARAAIANTQVPVEQAIAFARGDARYASAGTSLTVKAAR